MEKIGMVGVDSGQLIITDPCYLNDFKCDKCEVEEKYFLEAREDIKIEKDGVKILIKKGQELEVCTNKGIWFYIVDTINNGKLQVIKREYTNTKNDYSYNGCCGATLSEKGGGQLSNDGFNEVGVAVSTGYGDGYWNLSVKSLISAQTGIASFAKTDLNTHQ